MELSDMEQLWKEHDSKLDKLMVFKAEALKQLNLFPAVNDFNKLLNLSVLGRNLALVYAIISVGLSVMVFPEYELMVPAIIGGVFMLLSFLHHLGYTARLKKLNFYDIPVIELQKNINQFKVKALSAGKYDFAVMVIWMLTIMPAIAKLWLHKNINLKSEVAPYYLLSSLILILVLLLLNNKMYNSLYGKKLTEAEQRLQEILVFEESIG